MGRGLCWDPARVIYPSLIYTCKIQGKILDISMEDPWVIQDINEDYCTELCALYSLFVDGKPADGGKCVCAFAFMHAMILRVWV